MPSHATVIVVIATKENFNSLTQRFAKYQMAENDFKIVHWKYFYPFNQPYTEFSVGNIVMFAGKFIVENLEQYVTVSYLCVIVPADPDREFQAEEIPLGVPYCMFSVLITREPKQCSDSIVKTGRTFIVSGFIRHITSDFTIVKLTDFDFISANVNTVQNVQVSTSSVTSSYHSDIDLITKDVESTTFESIAPFSTSLIPSDPNPKMSQIQKGKNKLSDLALSGLELTIANDLQDEYIVDEDASDNLDQLAFPHLSIIEHPNKEGYVAVCASCISVAKRRNASTLAPIPDALSNVSMFHHHWLSPIHLSCSLGRAENANHFTHYRHLSSAFGLLKNLHALQIYARTLGAILDSTPNNNWFHPSLLHAAAWLKINNQFFKQFDQMFSSITFMHPPNVFPTVQLINDENALSSNTQLPCHPDIVVPPYDFDPEIHDEDFYYSRQLAGFMRDSNNDMMFYRVLNEIRNGIVSPNTLQTVNNKIRLPSLCSPIDTTHLVGFHSIADNINKLACLTLPRESVDSEPVFLVAVDYINHQEWNVFDNDCMLNNRDIINGQECATCPTTKLLKSCLLLKNQNEDKAATNFK
ncbi:19235_t:CDS:2 [Cetraspora pellucida]|uniref:19235_t:CDS:1 n=1 Tax=Cetraspora pellucida TaxID=1433469 RepID=A0A9N9D0X6_9GLOM|nr:19235_t:CDS:2 [Cetraspora pellucida]